MQRNGVYFRPVILVLIPILIFSACAPAAPTNLPQPTETPSQASLAANEPSATAQPTKVEPTAAAEPDGPQFQARLAVVKFTAKVFKGGDTETEVKQAQTVDVQVNDRIEVVKLEEQVEQSYSILEFADFLKLELFSNAKVLVTDVKEESGGSRDVTLDLMGGHMFVRLNDKTITQVTVETPYSTIKTLEDGTEFDVCHNENLTCVLVTKGVAQVIGQGSKQILEAGEASYVLKDQPPTSAICAPLEKFIVWEENYRQSAAAPALGKLVSELPPEACPDQGTDPSELPSNAHILYQDDFKNLSSGWLQGKIDNYFTGYSEEEYYQVQILSLDDKYVVYAPNKSKYEDANVDLKALTKDAQSGDFNYGLVFRRSGNRYYAFTLSPSTRTWYVFKSSSNALETLKEGTEDSIQGLEAADVLRVAANGSTFFFYINGRLVGEVSDPDYTSGEVGLFVQTIDSPEALIHFDSITIWDTQTPLINPAQRAKEICFNEKDDDGDRLIDKEDPDCQRPDVIPSSTPEPPTPEPPTPEPPTPEPPTPEPPTPEPPTPEPPTETPTGP